MHVTAIIAAGGRGQRFGAERPKQLLEVGGRALLERSVFAFLRHPLIDELIVSLPADLVAAPPAYLLGTAKPLRIVTGGRRRQDSVANAFAAASERSDIIVIHDGARPFVSGAVIARTIAAAADAGAAVAAIAARDTVKRAADTPAGGARYVAETLPRDTIFLAQTPQAFRRGVLRDALARSEDATDEGALAERAGHRVALVEGDPANIKITTREDLAVAESIAQRQGGDLRVGTGYDLHRLVEGRRLVIAGEAIAFDRGALGHSDADVVCHAVTDAILGAAGLGDIGRHFPDTDARWKDASSLDLLARVVALLAEHGSAVRNVDATVVLERPKIKDRIDAMRANLARTLGIDVSCVSVKGKTNEGVDAIGRGDAIAAYASALVVTSSRPLTDNS